MKNWIRFAKDPRGAEFVEYVVIAGVVALLAIGAFTTFGNDIMTEIRKQGTTVTQVNSVPGQ